MGVGGRQDSWDSLVGGFLAWSPEELLRFTSLGSSIPTHRALGWDLDPVLTGSEASFENPPHFASQGLTNFKV